MGIFDWLFGGKKTINKEIAKLEKGKQQSKLRLKTVKAKNNKNEIKSDTKTTNKLRANSNECEDIGIVTHYKGKPLTGICYSFYENTEVLEMEIEMIEGLKNGEGKSYDKSGKLESIFICENDKVISRKHFKNDGTVIDLPVWFEGKVYEKGDTVEYKGKEFKLSALELSIYDLLMGSYAMTESPASQFNPNYASFMINQKNCIEWFRVENPELFEALTATISTVKKETPAADISIENGDKINGSTKTYTKTYYDSGELESTENSVDGAMQGEYNFTYDSGELESTENYVDGIQQGEYKYYYESGGLLETGNFVDGLQQGEWKKYYESGELESTENYVDGKLQGESKQYYESGELKRTVNYVDGVEQ